MAAGASRASQGHLNAIEDLGEAGGGRCWAADCDPVRAKQITHSGPKLRFGPAATACAKAPRQPVEGRIRSTWRRTKFPDRSRLFHTAASRRPALSSGEASGWFLAKDLRS
jgi:hypothetical protein